MPDREEPVYELQKAAGAAGLPQAVIGLLPPLTLLFGVSGFPAFATAVFSAISGAAYGQRKMQEFSWQVEGELGRMEAESSLRFESLDDDIKDLRERLEDAQLEDLSEIFEHWMRASDEEWLRYLRAAIRGTVNQTVDRSNRKAIIAALRMLGPAHIEHLNALSKTTTLASRFRRRSATRRPWPRLVSQDLKAARAVLVAAGFARYEVSVDEGATFGKADSSTNSPKVSIQDEVSVTPLGFQALSMLLERDQGESEG